MDVVLWFMSTVLLQDADSAGCPFVAFSILCTKTQSDTSSGPFRIFHDWQHSRALTAAHESGAPYGSWHVMHAE